MRKLPLLVVLASLASSPAAAQAAGWSHPQGYTAGTRAFDEPVPRVAVAEDGTSVATFATGRDIYAVTNTHQHSGPHYFAYFYCGCGRICESVKPQYKLRQRDSVTGGWCQRPRY